MDSTLPDLDALKKLLKDNSVWTDDDGNSLLHHAARLGDASFVEQCLQSGIKALGCNKEGTCPRDVARAWGHDAVATRLDESMKQEKSAAPPAFPYQSLKDIRDQSLFHSLAKRGLTEQIVLLAKKTGEKLTAQDLLEKGPDGESVILKICQEGHLSALIVPELWINNLGDILSVLDKVPKAYQSGIDIAAFANRTRQLKLKSGAFRPKF